MWNAQFTADCGNNQCHKETSSFVLLVIQMNCFRKTAPILYFTCKTDHIYSSYLGIALTCYFALLSKSAPLSISSAIIKHLNVFWPFELKELEICPHILHCVATVCCVCGIWCHPYSLSEVRLGNPKGDAWRHRLMVECSSLACLCSVASW